MYQNPHNESLVREIDMMNKRKVRNIQSIDEGAGFSGGAMMERKIGGKKRGRPSKKPKMEGEGFLDFMEDFGKGFVKGFTGAADVAGKVLPVVAPFIGLGAKLPNGKQKGQRKYKKQPENMYACGGSGFASGTHMDTGFDMTEGAGSSGGGFSGGQKEEILKMFFSKGKAKKMKEKLEGAGFWSDFADGFTSVFDVAGKVLPVVAPFIGLGKKGGNMYDTLRKMKNPDIKMSNDGIFGFMYDKKNEGGKKGRNTTRTDLEQMGKYVPDKVVEKSQMLGSDMSGFGAKRPNGKSKQSCSCVGGADTQIQKDAKKLMNRKLGEMGVQERGIGKIVASYLSPQTPPQTTRTLVSPPAPKRRKLKGGRRTEMEGDFSGGFAGMGVSGGKRAPNAWLQLVNKVRQEQGLKGIKEAIAYIKSHNLYKK
jgi:hypothetical protein